MLPRTSAFTVRPAAARPTRAATPAAVINSVTPVSGGSVTAPASVSRDFGVVLDDHGEPPHPINTRPLYLRVWGDRACFARPEYPVEKVSYQCMTPSAARGVLSSIYFKPEFRWEVREIRILNPIRTFAETRNETSVPATWDSLARPTRCDEQRFQRHTLGLADVAYVIVAEAVPVPWSVPMVQKHAEIFHDYAAKGRCCKRPYLGAREWSCFFDESDGTERPAAINMDLGAMTFDFHYTRRDGSDKPITAMDFNDVRVIPVRFRARIVDGVLTVPPTLYRYAGGCLGSERRRPELPPTVDV